MFTVLLKFCGVNSGRWWVDFVQDAWWRELLFENVLFAARSAGPSLLTVFGDEPWIEYEVFPSSEESIVHLTMGLGRHITARLTGEARALSRVRQARND